jgi:uncharacterized alkaline shock family protein YloU
MQTGERVREKESLGSITIDPEVLSDLILLKVKEVPGVIEVLKQDASRALTRLYPTKGEPNRYKMVGEEVSVEVHLKARGDVNVRSLGEAVQNAIKQEIEDLLGLRAGPINVYIDEIEFPNKEK